MRIRHIIKLAVIEDTGPGEALFLKVPGKIHDRERRSRITLRVPSSDQGQWFYLFVAIFDQAIPADG